MNHIVDELKKGLNWKERIIIKVFAKTFIKVYNNTRVIIVNKFLE